MSLKLLELDSIVSKFDFLFVNCGNNKTNLNPG